MNTNKKTVCIIQARTGSTRLPLKVLIPLEGKPLLLRVLDRALEAKTLDHIIVATTTNENDQAIIDLVKDYNQKISAMRGSEEDVLDRYYQTAKKISADIIVRITSDNPLIDPDIIDGIVKEIQNNETLDYISNNIGKHTFPRGLDTEAIRFATLEHLWKTTTEPSDREHVTIHIKRFPESFKTKTFLNDVDYSNYRWTVDEEADFIFVSEIYKQLYSQKKQFRMEDVIAFLEKHPEIRKINEHIEQQNAQY
ncbi:MAG: acylneuraminate cytidylyltransferase [Candidatus Harrisonbacteria bacterium CG10_big_fil_rev_8_21_14_0_10_42_17]|uniref:Acylneuraminate cytidylyltransferase n=1 Tax=Candidatus Harrisonbacteria bacterium CG10_big_fil_rev_8_21_14_0_10_42_17 TaxID=1974584 RepID=A0A2M6WIC6_9BACT|nr:MAG: acylneuraminate cytidylyltransferase [Candidatus Harrisonbacteria bacterium CG10_big_fil_rev_8_21_14_0_10_42_17]